MTPTDAPLEPFAPAEEDIPETIANAAVLSDLVALLDDLELPLPFTPPELLEQLMEAAPNVFSTDIRVDSLYGLGAIDRLWSEQDPPQPFLAFGYDGGGLARNRLQCAVSGPALAMAGEAPLGNYYADPEEEMAGAKALLDAMATLYQLTGGCRELPGRPGERWVIVQPASGGFWTRCPAGGEPESLDTNTPLARALSMLQP